jgi:hypothetical protein
MIFSKDIAAASESNGVKVLYGALPLAYFTAVLWLGAFNSLLAFPLPPKYKTFALAIYLFLVVFVYLSGPQIVGLAQQNVESSRLVYVEKSRVVLTVINPEGYWLAGIGFVVGS